MFVLCCYYYVDTASGNALCVCVCVITFSVLFPERLSICFYNGEGFFFEVRA
jgi:hypothetical protein